MSDNKRILFLLVIITFFSSNFLLAGPCDKNFFLSKTKKFVSKFEENKFIKIKNEISQTGTIPKLDSPESKLAYISTKLENESRLLTKQIDNLRQLSKKEVRSLIKLTKIFNKKGNVSEAKLQGKLNYFYKASNNKNKANKALKHLEDQVMTRVAVGLINKAATDDGIIKAKNLIKRSITKLFANKRFQTLSNIYVNAPIVFTGGLPFLLRYDFYQIDKKMIENAALYGSENAVKEFFSKNEVAIKRQVVFNRVRKYFNSVVLSVFLASSVYAESVKAIEYSQQVKIETEKADQILDDGVSKLENEAKTLVLTVEKMDLRDSFFELALINYEKNNGLKLVETDMDYLKIWSGIYNKEYPNKLEL